MDAFRALNLIKRGKGRHRDDPVASRRRAELIETTWPYWRESFDTDMWDPIPLIADAARDDVFERTRVGMSGPRRGITIDREIEGPRILELLREWGMLPDS